MTDRLSADLASLRIDRSAPPPRRTGWIVLAILAVVLLAGGASAWASLSARWFKTPVDLTEIRMVSPAQAAIQVTSTGYLMPQRTAAVASKSLGRVAEVFVREGQPVTAGALLVRLEGAEPAAAVAAARARATAAKARQISALAAVTEAQRAWEREQRLAERDAATRARAEDLALRLDVLRATADAARADFDAANADLSVAGLNVGHTELYAPMAGVVWARPVAVGELLGPGLPAGVQIADFTSLMVETDVPEGKLSLVTVDGPCEVVLDAWPTTRHRAVVAEISPRVNRAKATALVKVRLLEPPEGLLPDMSARVSFLSAEIAAGDEATPPRLFVPGSAIVDRGGQKLVFRVESGRAVQTTISVGEPMAGGFALVSGPESGTRVISNPPPELVDGAPVQESAE